jgi:hypothetical protein
MIILKTAVAFCLSLAIIRTSCKNEQVSNDRDLLTTAVWQLEELARNDSRGNSYYLRGEKNSTGINYDAIRIKFNTDGTGFYTTDENRTFPLEWEFKNNKHDEMILRVNYGGITTYHWKMVVISNHSLYSTTSFSDQGEHLMVTTRFIPTR